MSQAYDASAFEPPPDAEAFYAESLRLLGESGIPFLLSGTYAVCAYTGIVRPTKDLDVFIRRADWERIERLMGAAGWRTELSHPHWLAKIRADAAFVDVIFNSGNGVSPVDERWFEHGVEAGVFGVPVRIAPAEETLWTKAFIMERERYDGGDVAHLLRACASTLDWPRLRDRFGSNWRVLLSHLVLFGFIYPGERALIPAGLMHELLERLRQETGQPPPRTRLCAGTLLSREQYLPDIEQQGFQDGRNTSLSTMQPQDVAAWTEAIAPRQAPPSGSG